MVRPPTDPGDERRLLDLLDQVLELPREQRAAFLDERCRGEADLRARLERMLELETEGELAIDRPLPPVDRWTPADSNHLSQNASRGDRFGPWELVDPLGVGGMGEVWRARRADDQFEREVALKLMATGLSSESAVERFRRERGLLARLRHPNIAALVDGGQQQDRPWLAMELVRGQRIDDFAASQQLTLRERIELFLPLCRAVEAAHAEGIVHRDLKPGNVLVEAHSGAPPRPVLLDFGIAKLLDETDTLASELTRTGEQAFTPRFAAPEQRAGGPVTRAVDVYALGTLLFEVLTGVHAGVEQQRVSEAALASEQASVRRWAGALKGDLDTIVGRARAHEPDRRYDSAASLGADLERHLAGQRVLARPDGVAYRGSRFLRRHRTRLALAVAVAALIGTAWFALEQRGSADAAERTLAEADALQRRLLEDLEQHLGFDGLDLIQSNIDRSDRQHLARETEEQLDRLTERYEDLPAVAGHLRANAAANLFELGYPELASKNADLALDVLAHSRFGATAKLRARRVQLELLRMRGEPQRAAKELTALIAQAEADGENEELLNELRHARIRAYSQAGDDELAWAGLERLLERELRADPPDKLRIGGLHNRRAGTLLNLGRLEEAEAEALRGEELLEPFFEPDHLALAELRRTRGVLHALQGHWVASREAFESAVPVLEHWLSPGDPKLLEAQARLAVALGRTGDPADGLERLTQPLQSLEATLGPQSRVVVDHRLRQAELLFQGGRRDEALGSLEQLVMRLDESQALAGTSTDFAARHALATFLRHTGDLAGAEREFSALIERRRRIEGEEHPQLSEHRHALAQALVAGGNHSQAIEIYRVLIPEEARLRPTGQRLPTYRHALAYLLLLEGDASGAAEASAIAQVEFEQQPDFERVPAYPHTLELQANAALIRGDSEHALALLERAAEIRQSQRSVRTWQGIDALWLLAQAYRVRGDTRAAIEQLERGLELSSEVAGYPDVLVDRFHDRLESWSEE